MGMGLFRRGFCTLFLLSSLLHGEQLPPHPLIVRPVDESQLTTVRGSTHPLARPQFDLGIAPPDLPLQRMLLVLKRSPQQDYALHQFLDDQQDKASSNYHKWLTPDEFGQQFGSSGQDIQQVTAWLLSHGLQINRVSRGRSVIEFSGTESQVESALHTQIHQYLVNGENHWANASDPQIPAALAPAVAGVWSLHDFRKKPKLIIGNHGQPVAAPWASPVTNLTSGKHALMPADFATIYNLNPIYASSIDGLGTTIAVVARSNIDTGDLYDFRNVSGEPFPFFNIVYNGPNPGIFDQGEEFEAILDATWSGAIAPAANVNFVVSASTNTTDGVDLSELYIIDNNSGDVMTESFSSCETGATQQEANALAALAEQAAAEGITYVVSSGDSGAEGCVNPRNSSANGSPPSVNILSSTPFTIAVGGTMFNENNSNSTYWNSTNGPGLGSAKSYIPENVWNESCGSCGLWSSGGGASVLFSKPNWQFGVSGIPNDSARDVPDVSLTAAVHDAYLLCFQRSCLNNQIYLAGGTSASAPSFAGIMALVNQQYGRQGQANYVLYRLAATETLSQCNGSSATSHPASTCIFNDVTKGNNAVPGELGYQTASAKYQAGTGYDLATGLGSVNVNNLVTRWESVTFNASNTTIAPASITTTHGTPVSLNITVAPTPGGSGVPTGDVALLTGSSPVYPGFLTLNNGSVTGLVNDLPGGTYTLTARYGGDANFAPSTSQGVAMNISPENSVTTASIFGVTSNGVPFPLTAATYGSFTYPRADVAGASQHGVPTGNVYFFDNGNQFSVPMLLNSEGNTAPPNGYFFFPAGQHSLTAFYAGDASFHSSTSAPVSFTVTPANTQMALTAPQGAAQGGAVMLTANLTSFAFAGQVSASYPTGSILFMSGGTQLGSVVPSGIHLDAHGITSVAIFYVSSLPLGNNTLTAQYSGDNNYLASSSSPVNVIIDSDFTFVPANTSISTPQGGSATNTLTVTGRTGYNSTINFSSVSCTGLPSLSSCSFSPVSVTGSGATVVSVQTKAATTASLSGSPFQRSWRSLGVVFAGVFFLAIPRRRYRSAAVLCAVAFSLALGMSACGGGSGGGGGDGGSLGTPRGSYPITVTATTSDQVVSHGASFTLVVQ
jgi:hypothetical protein